MDAGRELDALVAEKVMSLELSYIQLAPNWDSPLMGGVPHYSTDMAAAWQVAEQMHYRGWKIDIQNRWKGWACHVHFPAPNYAHVFEHHDTAPLAICLAALNAVDAEVPA